MNRRIALIPLAILSGFLAGRFAAGTHGGRVVDAGGAAIPDERSGEDHPVGRETSGRDAKMIPRLVSTETLESILGQGEDVGYSTLALWLVDAGSAEMEEYWRGFDEPDWDMKRLLFMNWTRIDAAGALAATQGTEVNKLAWWAWASNDPDAAFAAARTEMQMGQLANGLGQSQPAWLIEHFDDLPEYAQSSALNGLTTWKETDDPAGLLNFLLEKGRGFQESTFKMFVRKDPWAAYDWLQENGELGLSRGQDGGIGILIRELGTTNPDELGRMAAMTPAGQLKRKMEDAAFESLLRSDPDKAYESARNTEAPLSAAKRMAMIASGFLDSDPEKAFLIAGEILAKAGNGLSPKREIRVDNYTTGSGSSERVADAFFKSLIAKDPSRTLNMAVEAGEPGETFRQLNTAWAASDLPAYVGWVNTQTAPAVRKVAVDVVAGSLMEAGSFHEAGEWAVSSPDPTQSLHTLAWRWGRRNPDEAREWFQKADIPSEVKDLLLNYINAP